MNKTVMIVAGEASGDMHGGEIARYLTAHDASIRCIGMGSDKMRSAGVELLYDSSNIAVVGLWEVITHWPDIKQALQTLEAHLASKPPDLLILIDYQEFNLKLAGIARQHGIKVLFYVSPQIWAWRRGRIKKFIGRVDMMAVLFPFEVPFYQQAGIPVRYVGHPLSNKVKPSGDKPTLRHKFGLPANGAVVALLPGSRHSEIKRILPVLLETATTINQRQPDTRFILPIANGKLKPAIEQAVAAQTSHITVIDGQAYDAVACSDAAIVASGTATLEVALLQTPMAIVYKVSPLSYAILKRMIKVKYIGLANIVADDTVAEEFIQNHAQPALIADEIIRLLTDSGYQAECKRRLQQVPEKLGDINGVEAVGELALEMLRS